ncbi:protein kinase A regulatory subunit [Cubamyces menziesii]|nr:protein kinase A regulatory subunit [Cubamyces menziesii]
MSDSSTFDTLITELTRDAQRVQPKDALQWCANWFQTRLQEQRARARDVLSHQPSLAAAAGLPQDHYMDTPLSPTATTPAGPTSVSPFSRLQQFSNKPRPSIHNGASNPSPFGTLNVPGNALLPDHSTGTITPVSPPSFQFEGEDVAPTTPVSAPNPFASFANGSIYPDPSPGDYLQPPTATILARRTSVSAESIPVDSETTEPLPVFPKTDDQLRRIRASIANNFIFRDLDEEQETGVLNAMCECRVVENEVVIRQGDVGEYFYVVESGLLHCYIRPEPLPPGWLVGRISASDKFTRPGWHPEFGEKVAECKEGSSFGELALMYGHPRAATVLAIEPSTLWSLDRITFRTIILKAAHRRRTMYEQFLSSVPLLASLEPEERSKIADALVSRVYEDGDAVVRQGEMGDSFFFVEEGNAIVTKTNRDGESEVVGHYKKGDYFGELSLLCLQPRAATVSAVVRGDPSAPRLKVAVLDAHAFTRLLGPLRDIMERNAGQSYGINLRSSR